MESSNTRLKSASQSVFEAVSSDVKMMDDNGFAKTVTDKNYGDAAAGMFGVKKHNANYSLLHLDDFDKDYVKDVKLESGEYIFRFETSKSRMSGEKPLIKINTKNGTVHFLLNKDKDKPIFDKRGQKARYMTLRKRDF